jgi:hypothetical protein
MQCSLFAGMIDPAADSAVPNEVFGQEGPG